MIHTRLLLCCSRELRCLLCTSRPDEEGARNLLLAPPPLSNLAPDSPAPTQTPASANSSLDGPPLSQKRLTTSRRSQVYCFRFALRETSTAPPILNGQHGRCCNVCRQTFCPLPTKDRSELHQPPPSQPASAWATVRSTNLITHDSVARTLDRQHQPSLSARHLGHEEGPRSCIRRPGPSCCYSF